MIIAANTLISKATFFSPINPKTAEINVFGNNNCERVFNKIKMIGRASMNKDKPVLISFFGFGLFSSVPAFSSKSPEGLTRFPMNNPYK